jgi:hypothetical protein
MLWVVMVAPQKQRATPSLICVGIFRPASHMAYCHAVPSCWSRQV